jgi:hypothetical protein
VSTQHYSITAYIDFSRYMSLVQGKGSKPNDSITAYIYAFVGTILLTSVVIRSETTLYSYISILPAM